MHRTTTHRAAAALWTALTAFAAAGVAADTTGFTYQGVLKHNGELVTTPVNLAFRLYDAEVEGSQIGPELELLNFTPDDGYMTVDLDFGAGAFSGQARWLEVRVNGAPLTPRQPVMPTPYAMMAQTAAVAGTAVSVPSTAVVGDFPDITGVGTLNELNVAGNVGIGVTSPSRPLHIRSLGAVGGTPNSNATAVFERASDNYLQLLTPSANARGILFGEPANAAHGGIIYNPSNVTNGFAFRTGGNTTRMVLTDTGRLGVGVTDPEYPLHVSGRIFASSTSWVIRGHRTQQTGTFPAVWGTTESASSGTAGVRGDANHTSPGQTAAGVYGHNFSTTANGYGVRGEHSGSGIGVWGRGGIGMWASTTFQEGFGIIAESPAVQSGWAAYVMGDLGVTGVKAFVIDHPLDPENKVLRHYCTESPEPLNVYRGRAVLDESGQAWIDLPHYFGEINRDPLYHLTPIGASMPNLYVAQEVEGNRFRIAGGAPGKSVSWRVEAVRNDLRVRIHGAPVEVEKPEEWRGTYLNPELYNKPRERGQFYRLDSRVMHSDPITIDGDNDVSVIDADSSATTDADTTE